RSTAMKQRSRTGRRRVLAYIAVASGLVFIGELIPASGQDVKRPPEIPKLLPNSADEPIRETASLGLAATFLDNASLNWTRERKCGKCHTNYPYLGARPVVKEPTSPALVEVRGFFETRVAHWDDAEKAAKPRWDAEVVSTAAALAMNDFATRGKLHPLS